ncbi:MAG: hypothetical protein ABFD29_05805 [Anaerolineaceae bacterium]
MTDGKQFSLIRPSLQTPFHIDFQWWKEHDHNWRVYLFSCLCPEHQETFADNMDVTFIDWVDPETAEILKVDGLQHILMTHCAKKPGFVTDYTSIVDTIFRIFLMNGNTPLTPEELSDITNRPANTILRTLTGPQVYKGLLPCQQA